MPKGCTVCKDPRVAEISKALLKNSGTINGLAERFGIVHTTLKRHRKNCIGMPPVRQPKGPPAERVAGTFAPYSSGNSEQNASRFESLDPKSLVAATSRLVDEALGLLEHAKKADDRRLALAALREARDGLALLMKAAGMLANDATVNVNVDMRKQGLTLLASLTIDELRALASSGDATEVQRPALQSASASPKAVTIEHKIDDRGALAADASGDC